MSAHKDEAGSLGAALGAAAEGVAFYDLANVVAADVRVKVTFEDLGRRKRSQLERLESVAGPGVRDAAPRPGVYPLGMVAKVDCYVCGLTVEAASMPNQCPNCGAARYAFEQEIALAKAWAVASAAARKVAALYRAAAPKAPADVRALLEALAAEEDALAAEADREIAELRT
ncbi:MAG: hypothetical protein A3K59_07155 [Euryarchaeota archaeon RBG_19FT_COMBO_69_17]|nr:MAG: hypothetical protein A3K59_07155 [Euryarchaeota archaeon RBG_19FT_COMBO_69_17]